MRNSIMLLQTSERGWSAGRRRVVAADRRLQQNRSAFSFDHDHGFHVMTRHVAQIREVSGTCRCEPKFSQALRRDDHPLESIWAVLRRPVPAQVEVDALEELLGCHGMELRIVVTEPKCCLSIMM